MPSQLNFNSGKARFTFSADRDLRKVGEVPGLYGLRIAEGGGEMGDSAAAVAAEDAGNCQGAGISAE